MTVFNTGTLAKMDEILRSDGEWVLKGETDAMTVLGVDEMAEWLEESNLMENWKQYLPGRYISTWSMFSEKHIIDMASCGIGCESTPRNFDNSMRS